MKKIFAPGCALTIYKPALVEKIYDLLKEKTGVTERLDICCRNQPSLEPGTQVINICPGCDRRYRENYNDSSTISLWEILAESEFFPFPDYKGKKMTIIDACPTRSKERINKAIRKLISKMNIQLVEPAKNTCCGDIYWGKLSVEEVKERMVHRAGEMPLEDVVVYCISCSKSVFIGGKKPYYMVDLLLREKTLPKTYEPDEWHQELDEFIKKH